MSKKLRDLVLKHENYELKTVALKQKRICLYDEKTMHNSK